MSPTAKGDDRTTINRKRKPSGSASSGATATPTKKVASTTPTKKSTIIVSILYLTFLFSVCDIVYHDDYDEPRKVRLHRIGNC